MRDLLRWRRFAITTPSLLLITYAAPERLQATPCRLCTFVTPFSYPGMVGLIRRWIVPFACFVGETRGTRLRLRPNGA